MPDILQDTSPEALAKAVETSYQVSLFALRRWPRAEYHDEPGVQWAVTDLPYTLFNNVFNSRLTTGQADSAIERIVSAGKARGVPLLWWLGPTSTPDDLGVCLERRGFAFASQSPGMAVDLLRLPEPKSAPEGFSMRIAASPALLHTAVQITASGFNVPQATVAPFVDLMRYFGREAEAIYYLGSLGGAPVATCLLLLAEGIAGIYNVVTLPEARQRGIAAHMTLEALLEGRRRGYRVGVLYASIMGRPIYEALGFQMVCQVRQYVWMPGETNSMRG